MKYLIDNSIMSKMNVRNKDTTTFANGNVKQRPRLVSFNYIDEVRYTRTCHDISHPLHAPRLSGIANRMRIMNMNVPELAPNLQSQLRQCQHRISLEFPSLFVIRGVLKTEECGCLCCFVWAVFLMILC